MAEQGVAVHALWTKEVSFLKVSCFFFIVFLTINGPVVPHPTQSVLKFLLPPHNVCARHWDVYINGHSQKRNVSWGQNGESLNYAQQLPSVTSPPHHTASQLHSPQVKNIFNSKHQHWLPIHLCKWLRQRRLSIY